jgi:glutathione S-transferase
VKLYSGPLSIFSAKARVALAEKKLHHELVQVGWSRARAYEPHHPDVLRLNPKGQVPVLVDGDVVVTDSTLICEYLEDRYPQPRLFPTDPALRARCRQQEAAADEIWFPELWKLIQARVYGSGSNEAASAAMLALHGRYREFDRALGTDDWFCGEFGVADLASYVVASTAAALGCPFPDGLPRFSAWTRRASARPAVASVLADMRESAARLLAP